jgi:hypothetical protein
MKIIFMVFIICITVSCDMFNETDLYGYYTPNYLNNYDTIQIKPKGIYYRKVYDKNKKLILEMNGRWRFESGNKIIIEKFYLNLDDDLIKFPDSSKDTNYSISTYFQNDNSGMFFCVGYSKDQNCYRKLKKKI